MHGVPQRAYGPCMNTFWGCDTESMTDLSALYGDHAGTLQTLGRTAGMTARLVDWFGPDAEEHRDATEKTIETLISLAETIRRLGELLGTEAEEQDEASSAEGTSVYGQCPSDDPGDLLSGIRTAPPRGPIQGKGRNPLQPLDPKTPWWQQPIGGPVHIMDPEVQRAITKALKGLAKDFDQVRPLIGGPFMPQWEPPQPQIDGPLPEGESFDLDPELLRRSSEQRAMATGALPIIGTVQSVMDLQQSTEGRAERWEQALVDHGLEELAPLTNIVGFSDASMTMLLGKDSAAGQMFDGLDRMWANTQQTGGEALSSLADGDLAGAARAVERGGYRHADALADVLTASPLPAMATGSADMADYVANGVEYVSPEAAENMREGASIVRESGERYQQFHDDITDGETWYDRRRRYAPLPWDPQS